MNALVEYECQVPQDGYEVITIERQQRLGKDHFEGPLKHSSVFIVESRVLQPRSERIRRVNLFKDCSGAFLEFAQTPANEHGVATEDGIKVFADRYGPLQPDVRPFVSLSKRIVRAEIEQLRGQGWTGKQIAAQLGVSPATVRRWLGLDTSRAILPKSFSSPILGREIAWWRLQITNMRGAVKLWEMSKSTADFSGFGTDTPGTTVQVFLKKDPLSGSARLCIRPPSLLHALWAQLVVAIDGGGNLGACVQCGKWFMIEVGKGRSGRSDKQYCSDACRQRAYRERKSSG
jgi:hypothetical protein